MCWWNVGRRRRLLQPRNGNVSLVLTDMGAGKGVCSFVVRLVLMGRRGEVSRGVVEMSLGIGRGGFFFFFMCMCMGFEGVRGGGRGGWCAYLTVDGRGEEDFIGEIGRFDDTTYVRDTFAMRDVS